MRKRPTNAVGQLVLQIVFPEGKTSDGTGETKGNAPEASSGPSTARSKPERKGKWYSLIDKVYALPNLRAAWEKVRANKGAAGVDGITMKAFEQGADERLQQLADDLRQKTYRPQPVRRVYIPKSGGGKRPLGIPTVRDRIVQQALRQILEPIFEGKFRKCSHGFRPKRGCATALDVVDRAVRYGYQWVVDADIQAFFDTVDHERLLAAVNKEIADGSVVNLIAGILRAGVKEPEASETEPTELGAPPRRAAVAAAGKHLPARVRRRDSASRIWTGTLCGRLCDFRTQRERSNSSTDTGPRDTRRANGAAAAPGEDARRIGRRGL